jgi:two-component sensor histidine kinase/tetratricopeptide (TPR) repeat protein
MIYAKKILIVIFSLAFAGYSFAADADSLMRIIASSADPIEKMELFIKLGDNFEYSDPGKAIFYYIEAYETSNKLRTASRNRGLLPRAEILRAKSLRYMGIVHSDQGNYQEALDKYFEAKKVLEDVRELFTSVARQEVDLKLAKLLNNIGIVFSNQSIFEVAKEYYLQALSVYTELADQKSIAVVYNSLGIVEARQANIADALKYFRQALDIYTSIEDKEGIAQTQNNIGNVNLHHGNLHEALELYTLAYQGFSEMGYIHRMASTINNIGRVHHRLDENEKAAEHFLESIKLRQEINDKRGLTESFNNLGDLFLDEGSYLLASEYFESALEVSRDLGDNNNLATAYINLGRVADRSGNLNQAIRFTNTGLEIAEEHNLKFIVAGALYNLADYHARTGQYNHAYEISRKHYELSQEILDEQKIRQISELEIGYLAREKQQKIELLEQETQINHLKLRQSGILIFVLALLFLVLLISGIFTMIFLRQRNNILILKKEREASYLLKKTDNDLQAVLKSHAHAMALFDSQLNVIALNPIAGDWFMQFTGTGVSAGDSMYSLSHPLINELINDFLFYNLRGESREKVIEVHSPKDKNRYYYKIYSSAVFDDSEQVVQSVSLIMEDITRRRDTEDKIISDLKEKETLVKEIHHRVKNNLQVIISLIRLQKRETGDEYLKDSLSELEQRIAAMSYVHEELYKSDNLSDINFEDYLKKITSNLISFYNHSVKVYNHMRVENTYVNIDVAVPCGLIINELLSNSLKHAFPWNEDDKPNGENKVDVYFSELKTGYELIVTDNGQGMDSRFDPENIETMGLHLVRIIVEEQLRGSWRLENQNGLRVIVNFPKPA